jgi:iron complex transport system ATP-binding protein
MTNGFSVFHQVHFQYPEGEVPVFSNFSATLPTGFVSLVGPNGAGKSTLMLLAAGRLMPQEGTITLLGRDTRLFASEDERNAYASFIYQNMEFETEEPLGALLEQVYAGGFHAMKGEDFYREVLSVFELTILRNRPLARLSKGEMQRTLLAFAALYGSRSIFMDEPVFAMEDRQKEAALDFFRSYQKATGITIYVSLHELDLTKKYAETVLLFKKDRSIDMGSPAELLTPSHLEEAYGVPAAMLKQKEYLDRKKLKEEANLLTSLEQTKEQDEHHG